MTVLETVLTIAMVIAIIAIMVIAGYAWREHRLRLRKATGAYRLGVSQAVGDYSQLLGTFSVLTDYDEILLLSSTSAQSSLDLIGIRGNQLDFIEFKKEGSALSRSERLLKKLVDSGELRINYKVLDVKLPEGSQISIRD